MIQTGDPEGTLSFVSYGIFYWFLGDGTGGESIWGGEFPVCFLTRAKTVYFLSAHRISGFPKVSLVFFTFL